MLHRCSLPTQHRWNENRNRHPGNCLRTPCRNAERVSRATVPEAFLPAAPQPEPDTSPVTEGSVRVDVGLLDRLMNLVGELVLARNCIVQHSTGTDDPALHRMAQRLNVIASELQEGVMRTRMQPIGMLWNKLPRIARDLAQACGKQVRLVLDGGDTELDRTVIEAIKDPLTHLVRNALDHGIEKPDQRRAARKPEEGLLALRAAHKSGQVHIDITDDGAGLDFERITQKALARGLISATEAERLTEQETINLLFLPGFSTAEKVSSLSGRGVGLDVVRTNIERIGGTVDIQSTPGQGTCVKIKLPLTLAIVQALIVGAGGERFAIPQASLQELLRVKGTGDGPRIEWIGDTAVCRLRGTLLPLVDLAAELRLPADTAWSDDAAVNIVVLNADDRRFGLVVDSVHDTQEIVVKPLGRLVQGIPVLAGATILGDGNVVLILDVLGLAQRAGVVTQLGQPSPTATALAPAQTDSRSRTFLICEVSSGRRVALPLEQVARLEEVAASTVERAGNGEVVQCRGRILPLVRLEELLMERSELIQARDSLPVVVYSDAGRSIGLVVERILDIVETEIEVQCASLGAGGVGSAVIGGQVTDLLDLWRLIGASSILGTEGDTIAAGGERVLTAAPAMYR
jgi:two-component system, chemotaxis family, sensor kinase CheA